MADRPAYRWVSVAEAARLLGSSPSTIRRRTKLPKDDKNYLEWEEVPRPGEQVNALNIKVLASLVEPDPPPPPPEPEPEPPPPVEDVAVDPPETERDYSWHEAFVDAPPDAPADTPPPATATAQESPPPIAFAALVGPLMRRLDDQQARLESRAVELGRLQERLTVEVARATEAMGARDCARQHAADLAKQLADERSLRELAEAGMDELTHRVDDERSRAERAEAERDALAGQLARMAGAVADVQAGLAAPEGPQAPVVAPGAAPEPIQDVGQPTVLQRVLRAIREHYDW